MSTSPIPVGMRFLTVCRKSLDKIRAAGYNGGQNLRKEFCCSNEQRNMQASVSPRPFARAAKLYKMPVLYSFSRGAKAAHIMAKPRGRATYLAARK